MYQASLLVEDDETNLVTNSLPDEVNRLQIVNTQIQDMYEVVPDEANRLQILYTMTQEMRDTGRLADDVNLPLIAQLTKNFNVAELEGVVKAATSFALYQTYIVKNNAITEGPVKFDQAAFEISITEMVEQIFGENGSRMNQNLHNPSNHKHYS